LFGKDVISLMEKGAAMNQAFLVVNRTTMEARGLREMSCPFMEIKGPMVALVGCMGGGYDAQSKPESFIVIHVWIHRLIS
jgi:hypothetical protein